MFLHFSNVKTFYFRADSLIRVWLTLHNYATVLGSMPASFDTAKYGGAADEAELNKESAK
jgi:hypothetical protein